MKRTLLVAVFGLHILACFAQDINNKYLIGGSLNYSHDDLTNNRLLSNYVTFDKNYSNTLEVFGEFGYFLTPNSLLGIEIGYISNCSKQERLAPEGFNSDLMLSKSIGISLNPKYKFMKRFTDKIWFFTDFKILFQYLKHTNEFSQINFNNNESEYFNMDGYELKYGFAIDPGLIFKINSRVGIQIDYSLFSVLHSKIKETDDTDISFDPIDAWDYNLNMKVSRFNLGVVLTI